MFVGASYLMERIFHPRKDGAHTPTFFLPTTETRKAMLDAKLGQVTPYREHLSGVEVRVTKAFLSDRETCAAEAGDDACAEAVNRCISYVNDNLEVDANFEIRNLSRNCFLYRDVKSIELVFFSKGRQLVLIRMAANAGIDSTLIDNLNLC